MIARLRSHFFFALLLSALVFPGCGSEEPSDSGKSGDSAAATTGTFSANVDGSDVSIDYAGGKLTAELVHKINEDKTGYGCITSAFFSMAKADGSCALELTFQPGAGDGLALSEAKFYAAKGEKQGGVVIKTLVCDGFPGADKGGEVVWTLAGGDSNVQLAPVKPGESSKTSATLKDQDLQLSGKIKLKKGGKLFELDLSKLSIKGDLTSVGSTQVSCGTAVGEKICPKGVTYGNKVGDYIRRPLGAVRCSDDSPYDPGELCGSAAQVVVAYQHWVTQKDDWGGKDVIDNLHKSIAAKKDVGVVFVVLSGKEKVVVENPPDSGKYEASGPAATQADCETVRKLYNLPDSVVMVYDKDKSLTSTDKQPVGAGYTPAIAVATAAGKIVALLPDSTGKMDQGMLDKAIQDAIDAN